jgi:pimeloyl-ACP methyl ester carboxylesterase
MIVDRIIRSMPHAVVEGLRISYEELGDGEPVLFIPGTSSDSAIWLTGAANFLSDYRAIMIDPRDTPKSDLSRGPYTPKDLAADCFGVLDDSGVEKAHVVGYSLGGAVAQELALAVPDRVTGLTLVATWARTDPWLHHCFSWLRDGLITSGKQWADAAILWLTIGPEGHHPDAYEGFATLQAGWGQTPEALSRQLECDIAHDALDRLGSISAPALVVVGTEDVWLPRRYSEELTEAIPGARLEVVDRGAHSLPFERSEEFFALLKRHLPG